MLYDIIVSDLYMHCANVAIDIFSQNLPPIVLFIEMLSDSQILPDYWAVVSKKFLRTLFDFLLNDVVNTITYGNFAVHKGGRILNNELWWSINIWILPGPART